MNLLENLKWKAIRDNVVVPAMGRLGTFVAATLVPVLGASADDAHKVGVGVAIAGCLVFDWAIDRMSRWYAERNGERKVIAAAEAQARAMLAADAAARSVSRDAR